MKIFQKEMEANKKLIEHNDNYTSLKIIHNNNIQQFGNLYRHSSFYQLNKDRLEIFENLISTTKEIIDTLDKEKKTL